jgi:hypothetical protein
MCHVLYQKNDIGGSFPKEGIGVYKSGLQQVKLLVFKDFHPRASHATSLRTALSTPLITIGRSHHAQIAISVHLSLLSKFSETNPGKK